MTFKGQIKVNLGIFSFLPFSQKLFCNFFSILVWGFPMRILINCEGIYVIELLQRSFSRSKQSYLAPGHLFIYVIKLY